MNNILIILLITIVSVGLSLPIFWRVFSTDKNLVNFKKYSLGIAAAMIVLLIVVSIVLILTAGKSFTGQKIIVLFGWVFGISLLLGLAFELFNRFNVFDLLGDFEDWKTEEVEINPGELYRSRTEAFESYISMVTVEKARDAGSDKVLFGDLMDRAGEETELKDLDTELKRLSVS
jgi:hypothetical protein